MRSDYNTLIIHLSLSPLGKLEEISLRVFATFPMEHFVDKEDLRWLHPAGRFGAGPGINLIKKILPVSL